MAKHTISFAEAHFYFPFSARIFEPVTELVFIIVTFRQIIPFKFRGGG